MLRPNSRSCRTASIRSSIAGGLAGELTVVCPACKVSHFSRAAAFGRNASMIIARVVPILRGGGG
jgi:hypothetical protein